MHLNNSIQILKYCFNYKLVTNSFVFFLILMLIYIIHPPKWYLGTPTILSFKLVIIVDS